MPCSALRQYGPNYYATSYGCVRCSALSYAYPQPNSVQCKPCDPGQYVPAGTATCVQCPRGSVLVLSTVTCAQCEPVSYSFAIT